MTKKKPTKAEREAIRALTRNEMDVIWTIDRSEVHHHIGPRRSSR